MKFLLVCQYDGVHRWTSLKTSSLLHQQSPACLVRLGGFGRWDAACWICSKQHTASWCYFFLSIFYFKRLVPVVQAYGSIDMATGWKNSFYFTWETRCSVGWGCRIHWQLRPLRTSVLNMTLNNLMVRFQWYWNFRECGAPLYCHCSQVHSRPEWYHLIEPYLWVK